ncbi:MULTISPECIES: hypothetical protein [unclassified Streptomyces]|uniref:hypothetical protein n=1 Tax=unclassified Streptomyces TaxID=2593676 RepID=UPI0022B638BF|nr:MULTISPECIES: hypothetical protein [unclassified Streptomyces]MCZ7416435.1 hypothetical protein [Streptomyces sp. WMMC897]MCZ7433754.1 hypothetical protein [Streptomyces sp. WMMC1477]
MPAEAPGTPVRGAGGTRRHGTATAAPRALALWWNHFDAADGWLADQHARIARFLGEDDSAGHDAGAPLRDLPDTLPWATRRLRWARRVTLDRHLANLGSHSAFLVRGAEAAHAFLAEERARLARLFPDGHVEERYLVNLAVARR